jgi:hypothetical protein
VDEPEVNNSLNSGALPTQCACGLMMLSTSFKCSPMWRSPAALQFLGYASAAVPIRSTPRASTPRQGRAETPTSPQR